MGASLCNVFSRFLAFGFIACGFTLWQWIKTRKGFPQPLKAGPKVSLHDLNAIDAFLKSDAQK